MNRYSDYARSIYKIQGVNSFSSQSTILSIREFPLQHDPRRARSYQRVLDIESSSRDLPLLELSAECYVLRRVVVPITRSQYTEPRRIPNARDPRGRLACKKLYSTSKLRKCQSNWVPTLVENDQVLQEEETCAVLVIDVSDWEANATKSCYVEIIPHECNVQRAVIDAQCKLIDIMDDLPADSREIDIGGRASASDNTDKRASVACYDDLDVIECGSDGRLLTDTLQAPTTFVKNEDRPMLEINEDCLGKFNSGQILPVRRCFDDDEDEDKVIYLTDTDPEPQPVPKFDDGDIECINLDIDELIVTKKEPPETHVSLNKHVQRKSLHAVTLPDSDEDEEAWSLVGDARLPTDEVGESKYDKVPMVISSGVTSLLPVADKEDCSMEKSAVGFPIDERNTKDRGETRERLPGTGYNVINHQDRERNRDPAIGSHALDTVTSLGDSNRDDNSLRQTKDGVEFSTMESGTRVIADKVDRSNDSYSFNDVSRIVQFETLADVQGLAIGSERRDVMTHSGNRRMQVESKRTVQLANSPGLVKNIAGISQQAHKARRKRKRTYNTIATTNKKHECAMTASESEFKRRFIEVDRVVNDENKSDNCNVIVDRDWTLASISKTLSKQKSPRKNPSDKILQISVVSTFITRKASVRNYLSTTLFGQLLGLGLLNEYLKNYTATYNCINFYCNKFEKLSAFQYLRMSQYVKNNHDFWRNRYNHWHREETQVCIEDVKEKSTCDRLAITNTNPSCAFRNNQVASVYKVIQCIDHKTTAEEAASTIQSVQSFSTKKTVINFTKDSWLKEGNMEKDYGKIKSQICHSFPMTTDGSQENFCEKTSLSTLNNIPIKLILRKSEDKNNKWIVSASSMSNISVQCTLSLSNDSTENALGKSTAKNDVSVTNNACLFVDKTLPKWSYVVKEVPELDLDDFTNRPIPKKIYFDETKLSVSLQSRVKKRSTTGDSAIVSNVYESTCKRRKLINSTRENQLSVDNIINYYDDRLSFSHNARQSLEIIELSPHSCVKLPTPPPSVNICNINNDNNENTCKISKQQNLCDLEDLPKDCTTDTAILDEYTNLNENNVTGLENSNGTSFENNSNTNLQVNNELEDSSNCEGSHNQKDVNNFDIFKSNILNAHQNEIYFIEDFGIRNISDSNKFCTKKVDKINKKFESFLGESNIDAVKKRVVKYAYNKDQIDGIICISNNPMESKLQSIEEKQSIDSAAEKTCDESSQLQVPKFSESGIMKITLNNTEQEQQILYEKDANMKGSLEQDNYIEMPLNDKKKLVLAVTPENQTESLIYRSSIMSDVQSDLLKNIRHDENGLDVRNGQGITENEKRNKIEFNKTITFENGLAKDNQHLVSFKEQVDSNLSHQNIGVHITSELDIQGPNNKHILDDTMHDSNRIKAEHSPSKDKEMSECKSSEENSNVSIVGQEISNIQISNSSFTQDQEYLQTEILEERLEEGDFDFITLIQDSESNIKYSDTDYDDTSVSEQCEDQATVEYSENINCYKLDKVLLHNEDVIINNCKIDTSKKGNPSSTISEDKRLHNLHDSLSKITDDNIKSNSNKIFNINKNNDITVIDANSNDSRVSKYVKPDKLNVNNDLTSLHTSNLDIDKDSNLNNQLIVEQTVAQALLSSQLNSHSGNSSVESVHLQTESNTETMTSLDKSGVEIPHSDVNLSIVNNLSTNSSAIEGSISNGDNGQFSNASTSTKSTLAEKLPTRPRKNDGVAFNNLKIMKKLKLRREITAPENKELENCITPESNKEVEIQSNTLKDMIRNFYKESERVFDNSKVPDKPNHLNKDKVLPIPLLVKDSSLVEPQFRNNNDLLKNLNIHLDDHLDAIADQTMDRNSTKYGFPRYFKSPNNKSVKHTNKPREKVSFYQKVKKGSAIPNVLDRNRKNIDENGVRFQIQANSPTNSCTTNNSTANSNVIQHPQYPYTVDQSLAIGLVLPLMNSVPTSSLSMSNPVPVLLPIHNAVPVPLPGMNSIPVPLPGKNSIPVPLPGMNSIPVPLPGKNSISVPLPGMNSISVPLPRMNSISVPLSGINSVPVPLSGINSISVPLPRMNSTSVSLPGINSAPVPLPRINSISVPLPGTNTVPVPLPRMNSVSVPLPELNSVRRPLPGMNTVPVPLPRMNSVSVPLPGMNAVPVSLPGKNPVSLSLPEKRSVPVSLSGENSVPVSLPVSMSVSASSSMSNFIPVSFSTPHSLSIAPATITNNIERQMHFPNPGLFDLVPIQNLQIRAPTTTISDKKAATISNKKAATISNKKAATISVKKATNISNKKPGTISDKNIILASSIFPGIFDTHVTLSCSKTVFDLKLPVLNDINLPHPYRVLKEHDVSTSVAKIRAYKWILLQEIIKTITELENIDTHSFTKHIQILLFKETVTEETWRIQERILTLAQCIGSLNNLAADRNIDTVIEAIMGTIHGYVRDEKSLKGIFDIFQKLRDQGIFRHLAENEKPLTLYLEEPSLITTGNGEERLMTKEQKQILTLQMQTYKNILKVHHIQFQIHHKSRLNNRKKDSSSTILEQNITTTVSCPLTNITKDRLIEK